VTDVAGVANRFPIPFQPPVWQNGGGVALVAVAMGLFTVGRSEYWSNGDRIHRIVEKIIGCDLIPWATRKDETVASEMAAKDSPAASYPGIDRAGLCCCVLR